MKKTAALVFLAVLAFPFVAWSANVCRNGSVIAQIDASGVVHING